MELESNRINPENIIRPTEVQIEDKVDALLEPLRQGFVEEYEEIRLQIELLSKGEGDQELYKEFYRGWSTEDFKQVLRRLDEQEEGIVN